MVQLDCPHDVGVAERRNVSLALKDVLVAIDRARDIDGKHELKIDLDYSVGRYCDVARGANGTRHRGNPEQRAQNV